MVVRRSLGGAPNYCDIEEKDIAVNHPYMADCAQCKKTIVLLINALDTNKKVVNYTVKIREQIAQSGLKLDTKRKTGT